MNDLRDRMGQVMRFYDSSRHKRRFSKTISTEANLPKLYDEGSVPRTSHLSHLHPFIPTWVNGYGPHSPYIPGILQLLQKGDQVQLRDKTY